MLDKFSFSWNTVFTGALTWRRKSWRVDSTSGCAFVIMCFRTQAKGRRKDLGYGWISRLTLLWSSPDGMGFSRLLFLFSEAWSTFPESTVPAEKVAKVFSLSGGKKKRKPRWNPVKRPGTGNRTQALGCCQTQQAPYCTGPCMPTYGCLYMLSGSVWPLWCLTLLGPLRAWPCWHAWGFPMHTIRI